MPTKTKNVIEEPEPANVVETVTFRATHFYAVLVVLAFSVGILVGYMSWGRAPAAQTTVNQPPDQVAQAPVLTPTPQFVRYKIVSDGFPSIGPANAPITLVEFGDFQCPFCKQWHQETYQPLLAAYPGKIRVVFRDFPLTSIHPNAEPAAEAAQCANEQNAFWPYHDKLFNGDTLSDAMYQQYAQDLNLNMTQFNACYSAHKYAQAIQTDSAYALSIGVNSTPTFFINGLAVIGAQPLDAFKQVIDKELAGQIPNN
jgi:protein-disulfide isomerase